MSFWGSIKSAFKKVVHAVVRAVKTIIHFGQEVFGRILRIFDFIMTYLGILLKKKLELRVLILRGEHGDPVAKESDVAAIVEKAKQILLGSARIEIVPTGGKAMIWTVNELAPHAALYLRGSGSDMVKDEFGDAGDFFEQMIQEYHSEATSPYNFFRTPITCFVVQNIDGLDGISPGPLESWIAIDIGALDKVKVGSQATDSSVIAHELGHSGWLLHRTVPENLMYAPAERGYNLTQWQLMVFRSARCVSIF